MIDFQGITKHNVQSVHNLKCTLVWPICSGIDYSEAERAIKVLLSASKSFLHSAVGKPTTSRDFAIFLHFFMSGLPTFFSSGKSGASGSGKDLNDKLQDYLKKAKERQKKSSSDKKK